METINFEPSKRNKISHDHKPEHNPGHQSEDVLLSMAETIEPSFTKIKTTSNQEFVDGHNVSQDSENGEQLDAFAVGGRLGPCLVDREDPEGVIHEQAEDVEDALVDSVVHH